MTLNGVLPEVVVVRIDVQYVEIICKVTGQYRHGNANLCELCLPWLPRISNHNVFSGTPLLRRISP